MNYLKISDITSPTGIIISIVNQTNDKEICKIADEYIDVIAYTKEGDVNEIFTEIKQRACSLLDLQFKK